MVVAASPWVIPLLRSTPPSSDETVFPLQVSRAVSGACARVLSFEEGGTLLLVSGCFFLRTLVLWSLHFCRPLPFFLASDGAPPRSDPGAGSPPKGRMLRRDAFLVNRYAQYHHRRDSGRNPLGAPPPPGRILRTVAINTDAAPLCRLRVLLSLCLLSLPGGRPAGSIGRRSTHIVSAAPPPKLPFVPLWSRTRSSNMFVGLIGTLTLYASKKSAKN